MTEPQPYQNCKLCPRRCAVDRTAGQKGLCGEGAVLRLASASIHRGEEPPVTGEGGSGTIFITGCGLGCSFCQNHQISGGGAPNREGAGREVQEEEFSRICLSLQDRGAENINLVTGSHAVPALVRGIRAAGAAGLGIPVLWNSSAYELPETLELLEKTAAVYLPDLKTLDSSLAAAFFRAPDYPGHAAAAVEWMMDRRPLEFRQGRIVSGVIVRHLIIPGQLDSTRRVLRWFAGHARNGALLSLMTQYTPAGPGAPNPGRFLDPAEYETALRWLEEFGIDDGFYQELHTGSDWLPDFRRENPFSSDLSVPVWHWKTGFIP